MLLNCEGVLYIKGDEIQHVIVYTQPLLNHRPNAFIQRLLPRAAGDDHARAYASARATRGTLGHVGQSLPSRG